MARQHRPKPRERVAKWPSAPIGDPEVDVAIALAANLRGAMEGRTGREVGRATGVPFNTINRIVGGYTWPDSGTIARLEAALNVDLWPAGLARERGFDGSSTE